MHPKQEIHPTVFINRLVSRRQKSVSQIHTLQRDLHLPDVTMGRNTELSIDLKKHIIGLNNPGKSL